MELIEKENSLSAGEYRESTRVISSFMSKVYGWMSFALLITALTAYVVSNSEALLSMILGSKISFYGLLIAEFAIVFAISGAINKMSSSLMSVLFVLYSILNGATLSVILLIYTESSIASTFVVCATMFAIMSIFGMVTKKDLTSIGKMCFFALIGIIIASIVNIFLGSDTTNLIISYVGVIIFIGLTAYDTQKLKVIALMGYQDGEMGYKLAIQGALSLYLDFINLFLYLLRILGNRK